MACIPKTSVALLNAIAASSDSLRWYEFYDTYQPILEAYLRSDKFRNGCCPLDVDEIIQETMITFMKKLPDYRYEPETKGCFHHYLLKIAKYKALEYVRCRRREAARIDKFEAQRDVLQHARVLTSNEWELERIVEIAMRQILMNTSISVRDREVFRRTTSGEPPESVADAFGITRNNVDQIKNRLMKKLRAIADELNRSE